MYTKICFNLKLTELAAEKEREQLKVTAGAYTSRNSCCENFYGKQQEHNSTPEMRKIQLTRQWQRH